MVNPNYPNNNGQQPQYPQGGGFPGYPQGYAAQAPQAGADGGAAQPGSFPPLSLMGSSRYTPFEPHGSDLLTGDGFFQGRVLKAKPGRGKNAPYNYVVNFELEILDPDNAGKKVYKTAPYTGMMKDGRPNAYQILDAAVAIGTPLASIQSQEGQQLDIIGFVNRMIGQTAVLYCTSKETERNQVKTGRWQSDASFSTPDQYKDAVATNQTRARLPEAAAKQLLGEGEQPWGYQPGTLTAATAPQQPIGQTPAFGGQPQAPAAPAAFNPAIQQVAPQQYAQPQAPQQTPQQFAPQGVPQMPQGAFQAPAAFGQTPAFGGQPQAPAFGQPQQPQAPQGYPGAPQQFAPQGVPQMPQGYAPQQQAPQGPPAQMPPGARAAVDAV